jgi:hypothetical protein
VKKINLDWSSAIGWAQLGGLTCKPLKVVNSFYGLHEMQENESKIKTRFPPLSSLREKFRPVFDQITFDTKEEAKQKLFFDFI